MTLRNGNIPVIRIPIIIEQEHLIMSWSFLAKNLSISNGRETMMQHCQCCMVAYRRHANISFLHELATNILRRWRKHPTLSTGACLTQRKYSRYPNPNNYWAAASEYVAVFSEEFNYRKWPGNHGAVL